MATKSKPEAPEATAEAPSGIQIVDNTESTAKAPKAAEVAEEYELTEGLLQVNYR